MPLLLSLPKHVSHAQNAMHEQLSWLEARLSVKQQGYCSYSVYAGLDQEYVIQFRLKSLELKDEISVLARKIYGQLAPSVSFKGKMGDETSGKEPLYVYIMDRMKGVT